MAFAVTCGSTRGVRATLRSPAGKLTNKDTHGTLDSAMRDLSDGGNDVVSPDGECAHPLGGACQLNVAEIVAAPTAGYPRLRRRRGGPTLQGPQPSAHTIQRLDLALGHRCGNTLSCSDFASIMMTVDIELGLHLVDVGAKQSE